MNKDNAIRAVDKLIEAERLRQDESAGFLSRGLALRYPLLKKVPASARGRLVRTARLQALGHRGLQLLAFVCLGALLRVIYLTAVLGEPDSPQRWLLPMLGLVAVMVASQFLMLARLSDLVEGYRSEQEAPR